MAVSDKNTETLYTAVNIVIPVYNEGETIRETLHEIDRKVTTPHKIFIVYDFDEDTTVPAVRALMGKRSNIELIKNKCGRGALNAIKTGFASIDSGVVLIVMADLADDLIQVDEMFRKLNEGYDIVCGSRYMREGKQIGGPRFKKILSRLAGVSLHYLTGIATLDVTNSFKMYTKRVLDDMTIESDGGFEIGMEVVVKAFLKGYRIAEVPSHWHARKKGRSRFRLWRWLPKYIHWYLFAVIRCMGKGTKALQRRNKDTKMVYPKG